MSARADEHERHADVTEAIGESVGDAQRSREQAQRLRAAAAHDKEVAERESRLARRLTR
jgi:hypothetical protein